MMAMRDVAVSSGSACTSANPEPSHVLRAMGLDEDLARASLRFGLGRFTTAEEIDFAIDRVSEAVARLRRMSAVWTSARRSPLAFVGCVESSTTHLPGTALSRPLLPPPFQLGDERRVLGRVESPIQSVVDSGLVVGHERGHVEPQTGEDPRSEDSVCHPGSSLQTDPRPARTSESLVPAGPTRDIP